MDAIPDSFSLAEGENCDILSVWKGGGSVKRTLKKEQKQIILGAVALVVGLILLVILGTAALPEPAEPPEETVPETTGGPEANPYGPLDFQYDGRYLQCLAGPSRLGVDVSAYQGQIDWEQVRQAGVEFAMIRVGYRGYETGKINPDELAQANLEGAAAAGLDVGVYFYSQAVTPEEAIAEADFVLEFLAGRELTMPVVFDWEYVSPEARTGAVGKELLTQLTDIFCQRIQAGGYEPMIYFNQNQGEYLLELEELPYPYWLAMYSDRMTYPYRLQMWQYTSEGVVPGIETFVDLNLHFPDRDTE